MTAFREDKALFSVFGEQQDHVAYLHVDGELDLATSPVLETRLTDVQSNGNTGVVLDLKNVTFMDSNALHAFIRAADRATRMGRAFVIVNASPMVRKLLHITQTLHLLGEDPPASDRAGSASEMSVARPIV